MIPVNKNPDYFLTVAETRSISKAAEKLFISQPYLSRHIIRLETELGAQLLDRGKVPLSLTPAGEIYARYLESSRQMLRKLQQDLEAVSGRSARTLRLGFSNWRAGTLLPEVIPGFLSAYPDAALELTEVPNNQLYRLIAEDKIDFAIMNVSGDLPDTVTAETMMYEKILLAGSRRDPAAAALLAQQNASLPLDLHLLEDARVILLPPDTALATRVADYLDKHHILLRNVIRTSNASTALSLTAQDLGFCFLNETGVHAAPNASDLVFFDLGSDDLVYPLCVVYKKKSFLTPMVRAGIDMMIEFYRTRYQKTFGIREEFFHTDKRMRFGKDSTFIWDLDGTLFDSYDVITRNVIETYAGYGVAIDEAECRAYMIRHSVKSYIDSMESRTGLSAADMNAAFARINESGNSEIPLVKNAKEVLEYLSSQGCRHFVYTHRSASAEPIMVRLGIRPYFDELVTGLNHFKRKPDPEGLEYLVNKYDLDRSRTFYVGDRSIDMECAAKAGIGGILYRPEGSITEPVGTERMIVKDLIEIAKMAE